MPRRTETVVADVGKGKRKTYMKMSERMAYELKLAALADKAATVASIVSDGDLSMVNAARREVRMRYYWLKAGVDGRGSKVHFCWSIHRDSAGKFRSWREVHTQSEIKRSMMAYRNAKHKAKELAYKRLAAYRRKHEPQGV